MTNPDNVGGLPAKWLAEADADEKRAGYETAEAITLRRVAAELCRAAPAGGDEPAIEVWPEWVRIAVNRANDAGREAGRAEAVSAPAGSGEVSDAIQFLRDCAANSGGVHITSERCRRAREILSLLSGEEPIRELLESCWLAIDSIQGGGAAKVELLRRIDVALLRKLQQGAEQEAARYRWLRDEASRAQIAIFIGRRGTSLAADRVCDAGIEIAASQGQEGGTNG